jgi:hypothetical protein
MFFYCECPECEFSIVSMEPEQDCWLCASDNNHSVRMQCREATAADKPEGYDARTEVKKS